MKISPHNPNTHRVSGVALVMVLCILVLISGLTLAFFSTVSTESEMGASRTSQAEADHLADSALQLVIGQIREATTQAVGPGHLSRGLSATLMPVGR